MEKREMVDSILDRRKKVDQMIHDNYHKMAQRFGLSLSQFHLLLELDELMIDEDNEQPTIGLLARNVNVSQNTISERVSRLEKKGLVERIMDKNDRRINHVVLTGAGRNLMNAVSSEAEIDFVRSALLKMSTDELRSFLFCYDEMMMQMKNLRN